MSRGDSDDEMTPLRLATGLPDDPRAALDPSSKVFARAAVALDAQDGWSARAHAAFWTAFLPDWPRRGRQPSVDALSKAAALLARAGQTVEEIHDDLHLGGIDAIRSRDKRSGRPRPSVERGEHLLAREEAEPLGAQLRRQIGTLADRRTSGFRASTPRTRSSRRAASIR